MTTNLTTFTRKLLGLGHVIEDDNPIPTKLRKSVRPQPDDEKVNNTVNKTTKSKGE